MRPIPIANIYYMLCYAWNKLEEKEIVNVNATHFTDLLNLLARVLITGISRLLKRGLHRDYQPIAEVTQTLRGKINFNESVKRNHFYYSRAHCEYDEMDHDILHNQILKAVMRQLIYHHGIDTRNRDELIALVRRFHYITDLHLKAHHFSQVRLHRNNSFYDFLLKICRLVFEQLMLHEGEGAYQFMDFIEDEKKMGVLFEEFLRQFYKIEQKQFTVKRENIQWNVRSATPKGYAYLPQMQTDISLESSERKIIMDAKYYKQAIKKGRFDKSSLHSVHLYQLTSYLKNIEAKRGINLKCEGMLIYPTVQEELHLIYPDWMGHQVSIRTIDLNRGWSDIHAQLLRFLEVD